MEMRCFRKILPVSYKDHVTNEEARNKIQQAIGPYEDLPTTVKKCKLKWNVRLAIIWPRKNHLTRNEREEEEVDRRRGGKTTSQGGQGWSSPTPRGLWATGKAAEGWLQSRQW